ncbi:PREDICTED: zinc finger protein 98-like [Acromyrmex echinatior]|uniref:zinc finger protein 98-like n=1 Tax=Acromyrmex echinatior TaxID=103372 RepID=UPI0005810577|nr:PREDICTED: zinc finger protein 98-like [Acromyrmex echinatior]XP_011066357.1 PREDICTED: zinc finger protein 98-like [Acromyrmex echinatior]
MDNDTKHYVCYYANCGKQFSTSRILALHITEEHERPYKCDLCSATFVTRRFLNRHIREIHGENPYVCEICKKSFRNSGELNSHRFIHSDEKPHVCWVCFSAYKRKSDFNRHVGTQGHWLHYYIHNKRPTVIDNERDKEQL